MTHHHHPVSPLRARMLEDMRLRKLGPKTQASYVRAVRNLAQFLGRSPDLANAEDLRRFQLDITERGTSRTTINATISGLRFFFEITLERPEVMKKVKPVPVERKLPVILSVEEVRAARTATRCSHPQCSKSCAAGGVKGTGWARCSPTDGSSPG
jgi:site-specific recombinase XerD